MFKQLFVAALLLAGLAGGAYACNVPNPNLSTNPALWQDTCPIPAASLAGAFANALTNVPSISNLSTVSFYASDTPAAHLDRLNDRVFVGANANRYDGTNVGCVTSCSLMQNPSFLTGVYRYLEFYGQTLSYSTKGLVGGTFASRSSDAAVAQNCCSQAIAAVTFNDNLATPQGAWGIYSSSVASNGAGSLVNEIEIGNLGPSVTLNPYTESGVATSDLWLGCGGEAATVTTVNNCGAAITFLKNGASFNVGLNIFKDAIAGTNGVTGTGRAIQLVKGHEVCWAEPGTNTTNAACIRSDAATAAGPVLLQFLPSSLSISAPSPTFAVAGTANGQAANLAIYDFTTAKWFIQKDTSNNFLIIDQANSTTAVQIQPSTQAVILGEGGGKQVAINGYLTVPDQAAPATPPSGTFYLYSDVADHKLKAKAASGTVTILAIQ